MEFKVKANKESFLIYLVIFINIYILIGLHPSRLSHNTRKMLVWQSAFYMNHKIIKLLFLLFARLQISMPNTSRRHTINSCWKTLHYHIQCSSLNPRQHQKPNPKGRFTMVTHFRNAHYVHSWYQYPKVLYYIILQMFKGEQK